MRRAAPEQAHIPSGDRPTYSSDEGLTLRHFARLLFIGFTLLRFGVDEIALGRVRQPWLRLLARVIAIGRSYDEPRGPRLRQALERLGPIFIKFGQVLSTRRDLLPADIADELALLQDRVPPFRSEEHTSELSHHEQSRMPSSA